MLTCVILNYNDYTSVEKLYDHIKDYKIIDKIILVDNASTDDSFDKLSRIGVNENTVVIKSDKNGGYAYGNNIGLRHSKKLGTDYVIVCNPDTEFSEDAIKSCLNSFKRSSKIAAVSPKVTKGSIAYKFTSPLGEIAYSNLLLNKMFKPRTIRKSQKSKDLMRVDVIPGSFVMYDMKKVSEVDFYDENTFLYHEEIIIGRKLYNKGYIQVIDLNSEYDHHHSVSVSKSIKSAIRLKNYFLDSQEYYIRTYLNPGVFTMLLYKLMRPIDLLEIFLWTKIKEIITD